jgi:hypothetical protein
MLAYYRCDGCAAVLAVDPETFLRPPSTQSILLFCPVCRPTVSRTPSAVFCPVCGHYMRRMAEDEVDGFFIHEASRYIRQEHRFLTVGAIRIPTVRLKPGPVVDGEQTWLLE